MRVMLQRLNVNANTRNNLSTPNYVSSQAEKTNSKIHRQDQIKNKNKERTLRAFSTDKKFSLPANPKLIAFINAPDEKLRRTALIELLKEIEPVNNPGQELRNAERYDPLKAIYQKSIQESNDHRYKPK